MNRLKLLTLTATAFLILVSSLFAGTADENKGKELFLLHCQKCHPDGKADKGPALAGRNLSRWRIRFQVRHGIGDMPAFSKKRSARNSLRISLFMLEVSVKRNPEAEFRLSRNTLQCIACAKKSLIFFQR